MVNFGYCAVSWKICGNYDFASLKLAFLIKYKLEFNSACASFVTGIFWCCRTLQGVNFTILNKHCALYIHISLSGPRKSARIYQLDFFPSLHKTHFVRAWFILFFAFFLCVARHTYAGAVHCARRRKYTKELILPEKNILWKSLMQFNNFYGFILV